MLPISDRQLLFLLLKPSICSRAIQWVLPGTQLGGCGASVRSTTDWLKRVKYGPTHRGLEKEGPRRWNARILYRLGGWLAVEARFRGRMRLRFRFAGEPVELRARCRNRQARDCQTSPGRSIVSCQLSPARALAIRSDRGSPPPPNPLFVDHPATGGHPNNKSIRLSLRLVERETAPCCT